VDDFKKYFSKIENTLDKFWTKVDNNNQENSHLKESSKEFDQMILDFDINN